jgi:hypothetical protein
MKTISIRSSDLEPLDCGATLPHEVVKQYLADHPNWNVHDCQQGYKVMLINAMGGGVFAKVQAEASRQAKQAMQDSQTASVASHESDDSSSISSISSWESFSPRSVATEEPSVNEEPVFDIKPELPLSDIIDLRDKVFYRTVANCRSMWKIVSQHWCETTVSRTPFVDFIRKNFMSKVSADLDPQLVVLSIEKIGGAHWASRAYSSIITRLFGPAQDEIKISLELFSLMSAYSANNMSSPSIAVAAFGRMCERFMGSLNFHAGEEMLRSGYHVVRDTVLFYIGCVEVHTAITEKDPLNSEAPLLSEWGATTTEQLTRSRRAFVPSTPLRTPILATIVAGILVLVLICLLALMVVLVYRTQIPAPEPDYWLLSPKDLRQLWSLYVNEPLRSWLGLPPRNGRWLGVW